MEDDRTKNEHQIQDLVEVRARAPARFLPEPAGLANLGVSAAPCLPCSCVQLSARRFEADLQPSSAPVLTPALRVRPLPLLVPSKVPYPPSHSHSRVCSGSVPATLQSTFGSLSLSDSRGMHGSETWLAGAAAGGGSHQSSPDADATDRASSPSALLSRQRNRRSSFDALVEPPTSSPSMSRTMSGLMPPLEDKAGYLFKRSSGAIKRWDRSVPSGERLPSRNQSANRHDLSPKTWRAGGGSI